jgi:TonB family protein
MACSQQLRFYRGWEGFPYQPRLRWATLKQLEMKNFLYSVLWFAALAAITTSWAAAPKQTNTTHPSGTGDSSGKGPLGSGPGPQQCRQFKGDIICRVGGEVSAPKLIVPEQRDRQPPTLLANSSNTGCPCTVVLRAVVGRDGLVHDLRVVRRVDAELDSMAIEWVKKWKFEPAKKNDETVAVETNLEVKFR